MKETRKMRQKRLMEVFDYLRSQPTGIHKKSDMAIALGYGRTSMSAAMNGKEEYLTDELFESICEKYPDTFNIEYLLNGTGALLLPTVPNQQQTGHTPSVVDQAANIIDLYAGLIKEIESLRADLNSELSAARRSREESQRLANTLHDCLFELRSVMNGNSPSRPMDAAAEDSDY